MNREYNDFKELTQAEKNGLVVRMDNNIERFCIPLNEKLSDYFIDKMPDYNGIFDYKLDKNKVNYVLDGINEHIEKNFSKMFEYEIDFADEPNDLLYLIPITENLKLKIVLCDEYYGDGEYEKYIDISKFVINENTNKNDVDQLIEFINEYLR